MRMREEIFYRSPEVDENCSAGIKALRQFFAKPYFKVPGSSMSN